MLKVLPSVPVVVEVLVLDERESPATEGRVEGFGIEGVEAPEAGAESPSSTNKSLP